MVRLTDYVTSGGCACKIGPHILNRVLKAVTPITNEHVLADMTGADDASVSESLYTPASSAPVISASTCSLVTGVTAFNTRFNI